MLSNLDDECLENKEPGLRIYAAEHCYRPESAG